MQSDGKRQRQRKTEREREKERKRERMSERDHGRTLKRRDHAQEKQSQKF